MKYEITKEVLRGEHNGIGFAWEDGYLIMFKRFWGKKGIRSLIETANLLEKEGYPLKESIEELKENPFFNRDKLGE